MNKLLKRISVAHFVDAATRSLAAGLVRIRFTLGTAPSHALILPPPPTTQNGTMAKGR